MKNFNSKEYWENRYSNKGNSGSGSYGRICDFKSKYVNNIIDYNLIKTINDFGCGDSNQISFFKGFDDYCGYDVSKTALELCRKNLRNRKNMRFVDNINDMTKADLCMSLDVTYHIIEDEYFELYMKNLFELSNRYVLIYSINSNDNKNSQPHVKHRQFLDWISKNKPNFKIIDTKKLEEELLVSFYLFEMKNT